MIWFTKRDREWYFDFPNPIFLLYICINPDGLCLILYIRLKEASKKEEPHFQVDSDFLCLNVTWDRILPAPHPWEIERLFSDSVLGSQVIGQQLGTINIQKS